MIDAPLRIGTRGSRLALWQARHVRDLLTAAHPGLDVEIVEIRTVGDRVQDVPLGQAGGTGLFTKEIEQALLDGRADVAVHSLKDLPTVLAPGLLLAAVPEREDARDALIGRPGKVDSVDDLGPGVVLGTSSPRRQSQLLHARPGLEVRTLRGNVPTRLDSVRSPDGPDATVLALAGLKRLGLADRVTAVLESDVMVPAPAQGALGLETRDDDERARALIGALDHPATRAAVTAERAYLRKLEGGCTVPAGAFAAAAAAGELRLTGVVAAEDGSELYRDELAGTPAEALALGEALAVRLLAAGGERILARIRGRDA